MYKNDRGKPFKLDGTKLSTIIIKKESFLSRTPQFKKKKNKLFNQNLIFKWNCYTYNKKDKEVKSSNSVH